MIALSWPWASVLIAVAVGVTVFLIVLAWLGNK